MSDLYRIVPYNFDALEPYVIVGRREMLVEVVPDYEAAIRAGSRASFNNDGDDSYATEVREIVDAALEGTDK